MASELESWGTGPAHVAQAEAPSAPVYWCVVCTGTGVDWTEPLRPVPCELCQGTGVSA